KSYCNQNPNDNFCKVYYPPEGFGGTGFAPPPSGGSSSGSSGSAPLDKTCEANVASYVFKNVGGEIGIIILLTVIIIALAYMAGQFVSKPEYTVFAKDEAFHLGISVLLLIMIGSIVYTSCITTKTFLSYGAEKLKLESSCYIAFKSNQNVTRLASCYVSEVEKDIKKMISISYNREIGLQMDSTWAFTLYTPLGGVTTPTNAFKKTWSSQYGMINSMYLTPALISVTAQKVALESIAVYAFNVILPLAFFFRILIPTRPLGNMLIALAVGLYILIPFSYSLHGMMYESVLSDCSKFESTIKDIVLGGCNDQLNFWTVARVIPQAYFLPNFTLALFVTFLAAINKALRVIG
ncbi:hypothetical protein HYT84_02510, partial [Candidatus Micrarchaeota archaeon]|nr:hypothetical protein [Candidatus Micrarchaeota archaeon]